MKTEWSEYLSSATPSGVMAWASEQPWADAMRACQQDATWHAEGDVWTHTLLVSAELERLRQWPELTARERTLLAFTALFHDAGKPQTTVLDEVSGHIRSPHHASAGMHLARRALRDAGCDYSTREAICGLVRNHGRPPYLIEHADPEREIIRIADLADTRLLYLFALADTRGRKTTSMDRAEENLELFRVAAEEQRCYGRRYDFASDHARFLFHRNALSHPAYAPYQDFRCRVTLMAGLPGAGKDTWLATHRPDLEVVSLDAVRGEMEIDPADAQGAVIQAARERCREHLRAGRDFALNATNVSAMVRRNWINLFADYNGRVEIVYLEPSIEQVLQRNRQRPHPVPERVILDLLEKLEPPHATECHALIVEA